MISQSSLACLSSGSVLMLPNSNYFVIRLLLLLLLLLLLMLLLLLLYYSTFLSELADECKRIVQEQPICAHVPVPAKVCIAA